MINRLYTYIYVIYIYYFLLIQLIIVMCFIERWEKVWRYKHYWPAEILPSCLRLLRAHPLSRTGVSCLCWCHDCLLTIDVENIPWGICEYWRPCKFVQKNSFSFSKRSQHPSSSPSISVIVTTQALDISSQIASDQSESRTDTHLPAGSRSRVKFWSDVDASLGVTRAQSH